MVGQKQVDRTPLRGTGWCPRGPSARNCQSGGTSFTASCSPRPGGLGPLCSHDLGWRGMSIRYVPVAQDPPGHWPGRSRESRFGVSLDSHVTVGPWAAT